MRQSLTAEPQMTDKAQMVAGSDREGSGGGSEISDADGQDDDSDGETNESSSETEESDVESSSSSSESNDETLTKATLPMKKTPGSNPNTSQMLSLPNLDSKDLKEEWKIQRHKDAHLLGEKFGKWQDQMIHKGHNEWNMQDTMTCDHADPCKEAKFPDHIGLPLKYMKHCKVLMPRKPTNMTFAASTKLDSPGTSQIFPHPEPAPSEWVSKFLLKARSLGWPNLIVAICLLQELHIKDSL